MQPVEQVAQLATTVCPFCGVGCGLVVEDGNAFPLRSHPITQGSLSIRGWSTGELLNSPLRVKTAFVRSPNGSPQPIEPSQVIKLVSERVQEMRDRYGSEAIGVLGSARLTNEENRLIRQFAVALGTPNLDSFQRLGYLPFTSVGLERVDGASSLTVLAVDIANRHPQVFRRVSKALKRGAKVRVIDSRKVQLASMVTEHVKTLPGHELSQISNLSNSDVVLVSSEIALHGQGAKAIETLQGREVMFLTDYVNQRGMVEAGIRPFPEGASAYEMLKRALTGDLKALLVFADDPFEFFPSLAAEAFKRLEFVVVVDSVKTQAMKYAHVVLPGAVLAEKEGTFTNCEGRTQTLEPVNPPLSGLTERQILEQLLLLLGETPEAGEPPPLSMNSPAIEPESPTDERPFIVALDSGTFWNNHALVKASVTIWREVRRPFVDFPNGYVLVNPEDARELGIRMFAPVKMESSEGEITLPANIDERAGRGTLLVPMFLWEKVGSALGALQFDKSMKIPTFRPTAVKVVK
ncbi:MAG: molybdopterin oxidoreductase family protein [Candidatus Fervidibacter sp.]|uniref:molybdopterin oxidoreductase family protein n=1 Tax=Candidatus Fervidibacter sp. TaxID=3100871 RepID=UPI004049A9F0